LVYSIVYFAPMEISSGCYVLCITNDWFAGWQLKDRANINGEIINSLLLSHRLAASYIIYIYIYLIKKLWAKTKGRQIFAWSCVCVCNSGKHCVNTISHLHTHTLEPSSRHNIRFQLEGKPIRNYFPSLNICSIVCASHLCYCC